MLFAGWHCGLYVFVALKKQSEDPSSHTSLVQQGRERTADNSPFSKLQAEEISRLLKAAGIPFINLAKDTTWENKVAPDILQGVVMGLRPCNFNAAEGS
eukprot:scaffold71384_cov14-Tisochrysis_lutea.AAC.1